MRRNIRALPHKPHATKILKEYLSMEYGEHACLDAAITHKYTDTATLAQRD
jgi:hypothetical protein